MKQKEMIALIDQSVLNAYDESLKIKWLNFVNLQAYDAQLDKPRAAYTELTESTGDTELIIEKPYDRLYEFYVYAQICHLNNEITNYNNNIGLYNALWEDYLTYLTRTGKRLRVNLFSDDQKLEWLNTVNSIAYMSYKDDKPYTPLTSVEDKGKLLIPAPYNVAYKYYIYAQQELLSENLDKHGYYMGLYNEAMMEFKRYMIRSGYLSKQPRFKNAEP